MLDFAVAQAVTNYNSGYEASCLDYSLGVPLTTALNTILKDQDCRIGIALRRRKRNRRVLQEMMHAAGVF